MTASTHQADPRFSEAPAPRETFRLDMLWTDARYRSLFIQIVAFMLLMLAVGWLISNMFSNLERLGKDLNFSFLFSEANYDINQRLVTYESTDSHGRAALVGMLNTLLVSFLGCIAATLIGVIAGVLRLSKNWVVSSLMTVYIEVVRNVPLLLQILLTYAILIEVLPQPREFRESVAEPERATLWFDMIAATNRGFFLPRPVFEDGMGMVGLAVLASIVGFFLFNWGRRAYQNAMGTEMPGLFVLLGMLFAPVAGLATALLFMPTALLADGPDGFLARLSASDTATMINAGGATLTGLILAALLFRAPVTSVRTAILFVPGITVYYLLGQPMSWIFPELRGFNFVAGEDAAIHARNSLVALWLALSIYTGAFIAEIVRGGILAIPKGQTEAAGALGLRPNRIMSLVILPQALRVIIPPQISQYLNLTKNSSLAIAVGYMDVTGTLGGITLNQTGREMECILLLMAFYLTISLTISGVINVFNERVKLKER